MRHEWIFEVLTDMKAYAEKHGLIALCAKVDETLDVARAEIADAEAGDMTAKHGAPSSKRN
jgi:hypothetical protein